MPAKVVVSVAPGSDPEIAQRTYEDNLADISKFYLKSAQSHALGITEMSAALAQLPGAKMRYVNQQGQEYVHIEVSGTKSERKSSSEKKGGVWDFLLVDIEVPVWTDGYASKPTQRLAKIQTGARMVAPGADAPEGVAIDTQLFASATQQSLEEEPILQYGGAARASQIGATTDHLPETMISSLLVDIRQYQTLPVIELDLYARLVPVGIDKTIRAIIVRSVNGGTPESRRYYTGGASTLTFVDTYYPLSVAGVTADDAATLAELDSLIPHPYTTATIPDEVLRDPGEFSPPDATTTLASPGAEWISNNADIFNYHLWGANNLGQWADVIAPFSWAGGSWTGGDDMVSWAAQQDSISGAASGTEEALPFDMPGLGAITQKGSKFWYYDDAGEPQFADYGGAGDIVGAPPNVTGVPDTGTAYAENFNWGQVYNTYCYVPHVATPPDFVQAAITIKTSAFRGFGFNSPPAVWRWSRRRVKSSSDLLQAIGAAPIQFGLWEIESDFPDRVEVGPLVPNTSVPILTIDNSSVPENPNSGQYIGRLTFFQEQGAFAFKPAA